MLPPPPHFINSRDFASSSSSLLCALTVAVARVLTLGLEAARLQAATVSHPAPRAPLGEGRETARGRGRRARLRSQGDPTRTAMCCAVLRRAETACLGACRNVAEERIFCALQFRASLVSVCMRITRRLPPSPSFTPARDRLLRYSVTIFSTLPWFSLPFCAYTYIASVLFFPNHVRVNTFLASRVRNPFVPGRLQYSPRPKRSPRCGYAGISRQNIISAPHHTRRAMTRYTGHAFIGSSKPWRGDPLLAHGRWYGPGGGG